jgi:hypothetical protein
MEKSARRCAVTKGEKIALELFALRPERYCTQSIGNFHGFGKKNQADCNVLVPWLPGNKENPWKNEEVGEFQHPNALLTFAWQMILGRPTEGRKIR